MATRHASMAGLAIYRRLVEKHGGSGAAENRSDAVVTFLLAIEASSWPTAARFSGPVLTPPAAGLILEVALLCPVAGTLEREVLASPALFAPAHKRQGGKA